MFVGCKDKTIRPITSPGMCLTDVHDGHYERYMKQCGYDSQGGHHHNGVIQIPDTQKYEMRVTESIFNQTQNFKFRPRGRDDDTVVQICEHSSEFLE